MSSLNEVKLIGNLGKDPEMINGANGLIVKLSVATKEKWRDKTSGQMVEETEWHRVVLFGNPASFASQYAKIGALCYVSGKNKTSKWTDSNGQDRYTTEVVVSGRKGEFT